MFTIIGLGVLFTLTATALFVRFRGWPWVAIAIGAASAFFVLIVTSVLVGWVEALPNWVRTGRYVPDAPLWATVSAWPVCAAVAAFLAWEAARAARRRGARRLRSDQGVTTGARSRRGAA